MSKTVAFISLFLVSASLLRADEVSSTKMLKRLSKNVGSIQSTCQLPEYGRPWRWQDSKRRSGQCLVVGDNLVLTLADLVHGVKQVQMRLGVEPLPTQLTPVAVDFETNLALLEGDLPDGAEPLVIPQKSDTEPSGQVGIYWKTPRGRMMRGSAVFDRIDIHKHTHAYQIQRIVKAVQSTQSGIGGATPVFKGETFFGLAFSWGQDRDFAIIPCETIHRSFDIENRRLRKPTAMQGFTASPLVQQYMRRKLGLADREDGCFVSKVFDQGSGSGTLQAMDVLLSIAGRSVDAWGKIEEPGAGKIGFSFLFSQHQLDQKLPVTVIRNQKELSFDLDLSIMEDAAWRIPRFRKGEPSPYLIRGGFVFQPLSVAYLKQWGSGYVRKAPVNMVTMLEENQDKIKDDEQRDIVIISRVLAHESNRALQNQAGYIVSGINGAPLKGLQHLTDVLDNVGAEIVKLTLAPGDIPLWLSPHELKKADPEIQRMYDIRK